MKATLTIYKNNKIVNILSYEGSSANLELSKVLIERLNNRKKTKISEVININGLHELVATTKYNLRDIEYTYFYQFSGIELENLPRLI